MKHQGLRLMDFEITDDVTSQPEDQEISALLTGVYVMEGYTNPDEAQTLFEPSAVRKRGILFTARERHTGKLAGMIILVPPESPARRMASDNEGEVHLLGVYPEYRGQGLGRMLVKTVIQRAKQQGFSRLVLWTQAPMLAAQKIYESAGFIHFDNMNRNGREFKVYEMALGG